MPMVVWWPGKVAAGSVNNDLVDFTDFLPTFADIARVPKPTTYGPLDGVSFFPHMVGATGKARPWIFNHYHPMMKNSPNINATSRWVQDSVYKLYDTTYKFYNIKLYPLEISPIKTLTAEEKSIRRSLGNVFSVMHN